MINADRLELLTGGYYEPILPALPDADKTGQIKKLSGFIEDRFDVKPRGLWLTERVWEPQLPRVLAESDIDYTVIDDTHFQSAGILPEKLTGYYSTEEQGSVIKIFPIHKRIRRVNLFVYDDTEGIIKWVY